MMPGKSPGLLVTLKQMVALKKVTLCNDYRDSFSVSWNAFATVVETIAWWETTDLRRQK